MIALGRRAGHRRCGTHALCSPDTGAMMLRHLISMDDANYEPGYLGQPSTPVKNQVLSVE